MSDLPPTNDPGDADLPADVAGEPTSEKTGTTGEPGRPDAPIGRRSFDHWFGEKDRNGFIHRSWMRAQGFSEEVFDGRPVIGICNTWSELTPCNAHLRRLADSVKRGVWQAGGFPLEFPVMSLGETMLRPTAMLFRNLLSMDVEESLRGNPIDGAILLTGCDKTTPGSIMGAASVDLPTLVVTGGPMLNGKFRGCDIGSGTAVWRFTQDRNAGRMSEADYAAAESGMSRSNGHCMTMGTASTMACMAEALGLQLTGSAAIPAVDSRRFQVAAHDRCVVLPPGRPALLGDTHDLGVLPQAAHDQRPAVLALHLVGRDPDEPGRLTGEEHAAEPRVQDLEHHARGLQRERDLLQLRMLGEPRGGRGTVLHRRRLSGTRAAAARCGAPSDPPTGGGRRPSRRGTARSGRSSPRPPRPSRSCSARRSRGAPAPAGCPCSNLADAPPWGRSPGALPTAVSRRPGRARRRAATRAMSRAGARSPPRRSRAGRCRRSTAAGGRRRRRGA